MTGVFDPDWVDPRVDRKPAQRPATYDEVWSANRVLARGDRTDADAERLRREYEPIMTAVNGDRARRGLKPMVNPGYWIGSMERRASADNGTFDFASMFAPRVTRDEQQAEIFKEIGAIRAANPDFLKDIPTDVATFRQAIINREKDARARAREALERSSGVGQTTAGFVAGVWETMHDPVNIASMPLGGGGTTLGAKIGRSALLNGALELAQQPVVAENREVLGEKLTPGEAALNTVMGAAGGVVGDVVLPAAVKATAKGIGRAIDATLPTDRRIAMALGRADIADASDADVAAAFAARVPRELRTPDENAAIHVIERETEIRDSSPFIPSVEGLNAHAARMQSSMEALVRANTADAVQIVTPSMPARLRSSGGRLANDVVSFFKAKGYSDMQARGIAAGVAAEAASNHGARNPTSGAFGLGQWLGPRKAELIRRYGPNPTRQQQLEFLHWELQGGDHGGRAVLRQGDEAGVLRSYIQDFMRPAKGAETTGDLQRGMAALGREGEDIVIRTAGAGDAIDAPIVRPPEMDAEAPTIARPEGPQLEIDYADVPQLRRDLFADDASHGAAQDALIEGDGLPGLADAALPDRQAVDGETGIVEPSHISDQVAEVLEANGFERKGDAFSRRFENVAAGGAFSDGARVITLQMDNTGRWLERLDGFDVARDTDLREHAGDPIGAVRAVMDDMGLPIEWVAPARKKAATAAGARVDVPAEPAAPSPAMRDAIAAEPALAAAPPAPARQLELFDEPAGQGATLQADSLAHDMRAALAAIGDSDGATYRLEDGSEAKLADIMTDIDEDEAMIATIRSCL